MVELRGEPPLNKEALRHVRRVIEAVYLDSMLDDKEPFQTLYQLESYNVEAPHDHGETKSH